MKENRSVVRQFALKFVSRRDGTTTAMLVQTLPDGLEHGMHRWDFPHGRPTADQVRDLEATLLDEIGSFILGTYGVQGVLGPVRTT